MTEEAPNNPFGLAVWNVLKEHGLSSRGQRARTGVPHSTVNGWFKGIPPQMEQVVKFARGFGLDVNEWLKKADIDPVYTRPAPDSREAIDLAMGAMIRQLREKYHTDRITIRLDGGWGDIQSLEEVEEIRRVTEEDIQAELAEMRREQGREA